MSIYSFKLPDLGEGIVESEISAWYVKLGDIVSEDQHVADVMTDKAMVEVTSPVAGTVMKIACDAGEVLAVGHELISFRIDAHDDQNKTSEEIDSLDTPDALEADEKQAIETPPVDSIDELGSHDYKGLDPVMGNTARPVLASPSVRQRARDEDIDLSNVPGSGPAARISHKDLDMHISAGGNAAAGLFSNRKKQQLGSADIPVKGLRRVIAQKIQQTKRNIPHYSYIEEVDLTQLEELRQYLNANRDSGHPKVTLLPFIVQALVKVLPQFPDCNARYDDQNNILTRYDAVHAGIATMTDAGLVVPVIKHSESLDIWHTAKEIARLSQAARDNTTKPADLSGSTITITSLGAIGGIATTPIINAPETSIIGINKLQDRAVVRDGAIMVRKMMNLSSSFDHRIVDGYVGAQLIQSLKMLLENPGAIFVQ